MTNLNARIKRWLMPAAILLLAFSLRLSTITSKSLWVDEVYSLQQARHTIEWITANPWHDAHPPGYFLFLHQWIAAFGESEFSLRLPSAIFGTLCILALYALCRTIGSKQFAIWAAFLLAIDPLNLWYSQETLTYAMLTFLGVLSVLLTFLMLKRSSILAWLGLVLASAALIYFDYIGIIFWAIFVVIAVIVMIWRKAWTILRFALLISAQAAVTLMYIPQWPKFIESTAQIIHGDRFLFIRIADVLLKIGLPIDQDSIPILLIVSALIFGASVFIVILRLARSSRSNPKLAAQSLRSLTVLILVGYVGWLIMGAAPRLYLIKHQIDIISPYVVTFAAFAITSIRRRTIIYGISGIAAIAAILNWIVWPQEDWRSAASIIAQLSKPADVIVGAPAYVTDSFDYYYAQLQGNAQIVSGSDLKKYSSQRLWLIVGSTHEVGLNDPVPGQLTSSRKTIGHWQLYEVEILLLQ